MSTRALMWSSMLLLAACGSSVGGGGGGASGSAGPAGSACDAAADGHGCHGTDRMICDAMTARWTSLQTCAPGTYCKEIAPVTQGDMLTSACAQIAGWTPPADGFAADAVAAADAGAADAGPAPLGVCARWAADRADMSEGSWEGTTATCVAGTLSAPAIANTTRLVNLYRFLAELPAVQDNPTRNEAAQACALIMAANKKLSHTPASNWKCWTELGSAAAKKSNLSTAPAVRSVDRYMIDAGANNAPTLGHRRWILSRSLGPIGVGSTANSASCLHVIGGSGKAPNPWTAWPPEGQVPLAAINPYPSGSLDSTGWSIQSDVINLNGAAIKVSAAGETLPVAVRNLAPNYGSKYAIAFNPTGWKTAAGKTYHVEVTAIAKPFSYDVEVLACP